MKLYLFGPGTDHSLIMNYRSKFSSEKNHVLIIDFTNYLVNSKKEFSKLRKVEFYDGNFLIDKEITLLGNELENELTKLVKNNSIMFYSSITELNFSHKIWQEYILKRVIKKIIKKRRVTEVIHFNISHEILKAFVKRNEIKIYYHFLEIFINLKDFINLSYLFLRNFFSDFYFSFYNSKHFFKNKKFTRLIYSDNNKQWIQKKGKVYNRYLGINITNTSSKYLIIVSSLRRNSLALKNPFSGLKEWNAIRHNNVLMLESALSPLDIIKIYLFNHSKLKYDKFKLLNNLKKFTLSSKSSHHLDKIKFIELPKQMVIEKALNKIVKSFPKLNTALIPIHELVEGRTVINTLNSNNINTFGLQHGPLGKWSKWRFINSIEALISVNKNYIPKKILVEGNIIKKSFKTYNKSKIKIIGAVRVPYINKNIYKPKKNIMIFLDMHNWLSNLKQFEIINNSLQYQFVIRSHPSQKELVINYLKNNSKLSNFSLDKFSDLNESIKIYKPFICIVGDSGVILEIALRNIPCVLLKNSGKPFNSPLQLNFGKKIKIFNSNNIDEIINKYLDKKNRQEYVLSQFNFAREHILCISDHAQKNLKNALNN